MLLLSSAKKFFLCKTEILVNLINTYNEFLYTWTWQLIWMRGRIILWLIILISLNKIKFINLFEWEKEEFLWLFFHSSLHLNKTVTYIKAWQFLLKWSSWVKYNLRVSHRVAMSVCICVCRNPSKCNLFLGLSMAHRWHDQIPGLSLVPLSAHPVLWSALWEILS